MTVFVRDTPFLKKASVNKYAAALGFHLRGEEVIHYQRQAEIKCLAIDDVLIDYVAETQLFLLAMGIVAPRLDYPTELQPFMGRIIRRGTLAEVIARPGMANAFIKPAADTKAFTGRVVTGIEDLRGIDAPDDMEIWISDVVPFLTEWRAFIINGKVIDVRPYAGDYHQHFDGEVLDQAVAGWSDAPAAYSLDIGVTTNCDY
ncbi:Hypothetical protein [Lactobacillus delbrueckii subsp. bulgaricus ND02] [Lactiplantibacillus mudanjiangensis]|uniref:ATP-grasp domain-containing protein n=1 Tax=Lactiplantibacillus mudanjiangensis TaxID=1296538 RepID=A0A660DXT2_9LACO|nr:Hypothetical protein [Lactobacillus delbrueckii subsp. bulgaricus ND02] [Lactiplantibacillus mudanjiangensis]VDG26727.1 Hypothetical protein [Lactobacillus delbrueckii subsp. bulgaricus ND02] [Lactiplantibacillus mudanjiangensis]